MEQYIAKGQEITSLTTAKEGNALIMRKGRTSLLSAKVMLFALLKIENRDDKIYTLKERQYYRDLKFSTSVDYSKGLVAEIEVADLRRLLKKENSGSFYSSLREIFSSDPHEPKSLRNNFSVVMSRGESGVLGYAEVITACHYDTSCGKLFLKFSDEDYIKSQLWQIKSEYTSLPLLLFLGLKSVHSYRLLEILYSKIAICDDESKKNGNPLANEYSFRFTVGELQFMLGIIDITTDREAKQKALDKDPDWNEMAKNVGDNQCSNFQTYKVFRKHSLDVAIKEINSSNSDFLVEYSPARDDRGRKIAFIDFYVRRKNVQHIEIQESKEDRNMNFIVDLARELNGLNLTYENLNEIARISNYDKSLIVAAYELYLKFNVNEGFTEWFVNFRK